ncbi:hypothetical protein Poli38472_007408 [Pythium oligandrum]|uniref:Uncharacterized protein n=1 Tax=Pythium oligandrum TaxID=41045 RepID=A0A8K1CSA1_PYTOL|nr:hypothetical protein Poli38472_007408 [Pythium oligandrum]|eukprot:TMW67736.1 hypothetical protein Poli38472_007408 [Pythium oligandrum]
MATLTVALAMKNYNSTCFSETQLKHECKIFDQMFKILGATVANPTELARSAVKPIQRAKPAATAKSEAKTTKQAKPAGASNAKWTKRKLHQNEGMRFDEETKESCIGEQRVELQESDERINVLIVCATIYCAGYAKAIGGKLYSVLEPPFDQTKNTAQYPNITEIILLDLTTHESRAEFFGLKDDEVLGQALDRLIKKVVPEKLSNSISAS